MFNIMTGKKLVSWQLVAGKGHRRPKAAAKRQRHPKNVLKQPMIGEKIAEMTNVNFWLPASLRFIPGLINVQCTYSYV